MATVETLRVGDRIADKYVVERVLGSGGMGVVVAARHVDLDQSVAIKFILPDALKQHGIVERLLREARASAKLRSEHVARVTDVGRSPDGSPYLVMELLTGQDLSQILEERGSLSDGEAALYMTQTCEAIAEAHGAGIIHRDIKPANLFVVARRDGSPCVKVLDFGIAKEDTLASAGMTSTGSVLGTPLYMSPEQVRSSKTATPSTDIWALGITLYELVTGNIPYECATVTELLAKILTEAPIPPRERKASISTEMEAIILRCLRTDPKERFRTVAELQAALLPHVRNGPWPAVARPSVAVEDSTPGMPVSAATPPAQHGFVGEATTHAVPPRSALFAQRTDAGTSRAIPTARRSTRGPLIAIVAIAAGGILGGAALFFLTRTPSVPATPVPAAVSPSPAPSPTPTPSEEPVVAVGASASPAPRTSAEALAADASPSAAPLPAASTAQAGPPPPKPAKPPSKPPAKPPPAPTAKPGWGGLL